MRALFRACNARGVRYLLISGQATVVYGAADFSQDFDLWIDPAPGNVRAFVGALAGVRARVHKLTPPLTLRNLRRGHGFHFTVPPAGYLDVMGRPPRVGAFGPAFRRAPRLATPWGTIPVASIEDLVELKKTNRPGDYEVITRLALIRTDQGRPSAAVLRWAAGNIFDAEALWAFVERFGAPLRTLALRLLEQVRRRRRSPTLTEFERVARALGRNAARLQDRGRRYWLPLLAELRKLRAGGGLLPQGAVVTERLCDDL
jgi:hypothetical protein